MRNDKWGHIHHDGTFDVCTFYASGKRGPEERADGRGDSLARGYYFRIKGDKFPIGPFTTRKKALTSAKEHHQMKITVSVTNNNPDTIWNRLAAKLGRQPTKNEVSSEIRRIRSEAIRDLAEDGKLPHQRKR